MLKSLVVYSGEGLLTGQTIFPSRGVSSKPPSCPCSQAVDKGVQQGVTIVYATDATIPVSAE